SCAQSPSLRAPSHCPSQAFLSLTPRPPRGTLFPYTTLFRSDILRRAMPGGEALLALLPEHSAATLQADRLARSYELFAALLQRFGTDHPAVLVIDDLHRADRSSRDLLGFLAPTLRPCRVLVLPAYPRRGL